MEGTAALIMLVSGLAHAVVSAIMKAGRDKLSGRALIDGFSALLIAPAVFFVPLPAGAWTWLIGSWFVHVLYLVALIKSFEQADMTVAYPIARGLAPLLAATGAVLLFHETISGVVVIGIALISGGVLCIGASHPLKRRALMWAALTGVCIASYTVIDAHGVRLAPSAASYIVWSFVFLGGGIASLFVVWRGKSFIVAAAAQWKPGLAAGLLSIVSYGSALFAFSLGTTPRLAALRETSILFGAAIAVIFLGERFGRLRTMGVLGIAAGAITLLAGG